MLHCIWYIFYEFKIINVCYDLQLNTESYGGT